MSNFRNDILLTLLYVADEDIVSKELILYLDENVSRDHAITPDGLMSVCMMHWATSPKKEPSVQQMRDVRDALTNALKFAWQHSKKYQARVAQLQKNRMRGWRISEAHRLRKIAKAMNVPVK
jgi:hypothetical protein